jgi:hypothetical protein
LALSYLINNLVCDIVIIFGWMFVDIWIVSQARVVKENKE